MKRRYLSAVAPSFEASGEVAGVGEIGVSKSVLESELDLGIGGGVGKSLPIGGGGRWRTGFGLGWASTFEAEFFVVEKFIGLERQRDGDQAGEEHSHRQN